MTVGGDTGPSRRWVVFGVLVMVCAWAGAAGVLADSYDPPAGYYNAARPGGVWYTGTTLKAALQGIIDGHVVRSYDAARYALQLLDVDPNNANNVRLIYTGASVPKTWDSGVTWNREHIWPDSRMPGGASGSDLFNLRACNPNVNNNRGNLPFGIGAGYWDPNQGWVCRGDVARSQFYMATRYSELTLVNGMPSGYQMGDLAKLLAWHYEDPVDEGERRRNHLVYSSTDNPSYYQGNRDPFIDHPELVWAIWGGHPNDSKLYLGTTAPADGLSSLTVDLGAVIKGAAMPPAQSVTLRKTGTDPTTYAILGGGDAVSAAIGTRQAFVGGTASRTLSVGLSSSTATPGAKAGTVTIDNTDLTSAAAGTGSADGNDTVSVVAAVREHSQASFDPQVDQDTLTVDFGMVVAGSGTHVRGFALYNIESVAGFTARLDVDAVQAAGDTGVLSSDVSVLQNLAAGAAGAAFHTSFDAGAAPGAYQSSYTLAVSDENLPGATAGASLMLVLQGQIVSRRPADFDYDNDVDMADFAFFQLCFSGPNHVPGAAGCEDSDFDRDGDVDAGDFAFFQRCFNGPNRPPASSCE